MPQSTTRIEIRIRDRVGVVSEVTREIMALGITLAAHEARVSHDDKGQAVSGFRASRIPMRCPNLRGLSARLCCVTAGSGLLTISRLRERAKR